MTVRKSCKYGDYGIVVVFPLLLFLVLVLAWGLLLGYFVWFLLWFFFFFFFLVVHFRSQWPIDYRLFGLVVKASASREEEDPGFESRLWWDFFGVESYQWLDTPVRTCQAPGVIGSVLGLVGQPGVSILWLGEMDRLTCNFYLSVAACKIVWADPSLRYTRMLLGR